MRGIKDERLLRRLTLGLDDLDIPQKFDVQAYEKITHPPLKRHIDGFGISVYKKGNAAG